VAITSLFLVYPGVSRAEGEADDVDEVSSYRVVSLRAGRTERPSDFRAQGFSIGRFYSVSPVKPDSVDKILYVIDYTFGRALRYFSDSFSKVNRNSTDIGLVFTATEFDDSEIDDSKWDIALIPKLRYWTDEDQDFFLSAGVGPGYNRLKSEDNEKVDLKLGSDLFFATQLGFGIPWSWNDCRGTIEYIFAHRSNGDFARHNQGINAHLVQANFRF
jgi:hypothetical protein